MSFTVKKKDLFDMIQIVSPVAPVKSSLQILSNIKIEVSAETMRLTATDLDFSVVSTCAVSGKDSFTIAVNAKKIFDIIKEIPDGEITGEIDGLVLIIKSEHGFSCKLAGADPNDFPVIPEAEEGTTFSVNKKTLSMLSQKSGFAVSKETSRSCLCGVLWEIEKNRMTMVATDGHRLGCCVVKGKIKTEEKISIIVTPKTLTHILKIADQNSSETDIEINAGKKYLFLKSGTTTVCSKLLEGPYPDYEKVIPKNNSKTAIIEKTALLDAVRRVSILSSQKTHLVKFTFSKNELEIAAINREIGGEARDNLRIEYEGESHVIGFNGQYFSELVSITDSPKVRLEMNSQISACLVYPVIEKKDDAKSEDVFLIMPLRIMDEA